MSEKKISSLTVDEFVQHVSDQGHAMAGATIALSAAQAAALGEACLRISSRLTNLSGGVLVEGSSELNHIKRELLDLSNQDADAIAEFVALREAGKTLSGQQMLCRLPSDISHLSSKAAAILQDCRMAIHERVQDDLEMSIRLLSGTAQAALLLLDSNLRIWPEPALTDEFEPLLQDRQKEIANIQPVKRIRPN